MTEILDQIPERLSSWLMIETTEGPLYQYFTRLFVMNGYSLEVSGWGFHSSASLDENPYGSWGLSQDEALHLAHIGARLDGMVSMCDNAVQHLVKDLIDAEIDRVKQLNGAEDDELAEDSG